MAVCGPTAAGKSDLADGLAEGLSGVWGVRAPVIVVDSMQVYSGLEKISNQARGRPAELVSVVPVTERWTVARHAREAGALIAASGAGAVLDAGTGMYLNAILLDVPMAPEVPEPLRAEARTATEDSENPRRASRVLELELAGAPERGSIWSGEPRHETTLLYLRPEKGPLDSRIAARSAKIVAGGVEEARAIASLLMEGRRINPPVVDAIGVRELLDLLDGKLSPEEAREKISARTRRLARRQIRWFDKLARCLEGRTRVVVADTPGELEKLHIMHDTIKG